LSSEKETESKGKEVLMGKKNNDIQKEENPRACFETKKILEKKKFSQGSRM
jgi:hypothetical protein